MNYIRHISYATLVALAAVSAAHAMNHEAFKTACTQKYDADRDARIAFAKQTLEYYKANRHDEAAYALWDAAKALNLHDLVGEDAINKAERDPLMLAAVYDQNIDGLPELVTRRHKGTISGNGIVCFEAQFASEADEQAAIARVTALLADKTAWRSLYLGWYTRTATIAEVAQAGVLLAGCIKKSRTEASCAQALTQFLAQFDAIMKNCHAIINEEGRTKATQKEIIEVFSPVHTSLLRSARIILRAIGAKPAAINGVDCERLSLENLTKASQQIKIFVDPEKYGQGEGEGEEGNGIWHYWNSFDNPFYGVMQALEGLDAEHGDKIESLKVLRAQAEALNQLVQAEGYDADAQRAKLVAAVELVIARFGQVFANVQAAVDFMNTKVRASQVRAHITNTRYALITLQFIRNATNQDCNQDLDQLSQLFNDILENAEVRATQE